MLSTVRIDGVKRFAARVLAIHSVVREVILAEPDELSSSEFILRSRMWIRILLAEQQLERSR